MKLAKKLITDGIGTITINGNCSDDAEFEVHINRKLVYTSNSITSKDITVGTLSYSGQQELATFKVKLNDIVHYDKYKIVCTKGSIRIGAIHEHYHKDIVSTATPLEVFNIYKDRIYMIPQLFNKGEPRYSFYYKEENDMLNNKLEVKVNNELVQHDSAEGSIAGWMYNLKINDILTFKMDNFTPYDTMSFIVDAQPGEEFFLKERK